MHKFTLRVLVVPALAAALSASAYSSATVSYVDGSPETVLALTDNTIWKFADGMMDYTNTFGTTSLRLKNIASIKLSTKAVGIDAVTDSARALSLRQNPVRDLIIVDGQLPQPARLEVFSTAGQLVIAVNDWNGESVDASALQKGLYILKINNQTFKFFKI